MGRGGRRELSEYITIVAEVYYEPSMKKNKVRPCLDEVFPNTMNIECAKTIRDYPVGTKIKLRVVDTERKDGTTFLYSSYKWAHEIMS